MFLITGAGGKTGRAITEKLTQWSLPVRIFLHRPEQISSGHDLTKVEILVGDIFNNDLIDKATQKIDTVYHISPNMCENEVELVRSIIFYSKKNGVHRLVYHSVLHPQIEKMPHHWAKMQAEALVLESGLDFVIIQPTAYMQNLLSYRQKIQQEGVFTLPYCEETRLSLVDLEDVAEAAMKVMTTNGFDGGIYELVGTSAYSQREVGQLIAKHLHRRVEVQKIDRKDWAINALKSGMCSYAINTLLRMFEYYELYGMSGNSLVLKSILGRDPHSLVDFIQHYF